MSMRFRLLLSAAFALLGVVACLAYAQTVRDEAQRVRASALERFGGEVAQLVVANQMLEAGDVVSEANVSVRDWASDLAPVGAITSLDEVFGRELSVPVAEGAPPTELNFRDGTVISAIPAGHVAVSIPVTDKLGISRSVTRGTRVSAYAVSSETPTLIAEEVEVLSELGAGVGIATSQQLTIAVLPEEVAAVLQASASGELRLVMPADDVEVSGEDAAVLPPEEELLEETGGEQ